jgi:hypothetical protein
MVIPPEKKAIAMRINVLNLTLTGQLVEHLKSVAIRIRLDYNWERCMLSKEYQYTGKCNPNDSYSNGRPACGAL